MERRKSTTSTLSFTSIEDKVHLDDSDSNIERFLKVGHSSRNVNEASKAEKLADLILNLMFSEQKRETFIDTEDDTQLVTMEESQKRLISLQFVLAAFLSLIATWLIGFNCAAYVELKTNQPDGTSNVTNKHHIPVSRVAVIDQLGDGNLTKYFVTTKLTLADEFSIKLPKPKFSIENPYGSIHFLGYSYRGSFYIITLDGHKNTTILYNNHTHRVIGNSQFDVEHFGYPTSVVQTSEHVWTLGGDTRRTALWSFRKEKWIQGPLMPSEIIDGCGVPLNRTHVTILSFHWHRPGCIQAWTFDFANRAWVYKNVCQIELEFPMINAGMPSLECSSFLNKRGLDDINRFVVLWTGDGTFLSQTFLLKYLPNMIIVEKITTKQSMFEDYSTLFTMQGIVYMITSISESNISVVQILNEDFKFEKIQSFHSHKKMHHIEKLFSISIKH